jgi:hypothetical protein
LEPSSPVIASRPVIATPPLVIASREAARQSNRKMSNTVTSLKGSVTSLKGSVTSLKNSVTSLKGSVTSPKGSLNEKYPKRGIAAIKIPLYFCI